MSNSYQHKDAENVDNHWFFQIYMRLPWENEKDTFVNGRTCTWNVTSVSGDEKSTHKGYSVSQQTCTFGLCCIQSKEIDVLQNNKFCCQSNGSPDNRF